MSVRLWYPQLDVFDTVRRMGTLLQCFKSPPGPERLYIADFFLANPPLLHHISMTQEVRSLFKDLRIPRPEKSFLSYPSAPLLFHKMEAIQKQAVFALSGKGLISMDKLRSGRVELTGQGKRIFSLNMMCTTAEARLSNFLAINFMIHEEIGNYDLRRRTGLRRPS